MKILSSLRESEMINNKDFSIIFYPSTGKFILEIIKRGGKENKKEWSFYKIQMRNKGETKC